MNKIIDFLKQLIKGCYGFIIFIGLQILFSIFVKKIAELGYNAYNIYLISLEVITFICLVFLYRKRLKKDFIDFDNNYKEYLSLGFKVWALSLFCMAISNYIINFYILNQLPVNQAVNELIISKMPLYSIIGMIILGPIIEEMVFRLGPKDSIKNKKIYYIVSVLLFAGIHAINGIKSPLELIFIIPYSTMAFGFAYTFDKTDNIFTSTLIHTFHNTITILLLIIVKMLGV